MSKGSNRRPEAESGLYANNHERIFAKKSDDAKKQCCERDYNFDGDCDRHPPGSTKGSTA